VPWKDRVIMALLTIWLVGSLTMAVVVWVRAPG
jgi:hypothetical protein